jgi:hypothetical protein
MRFLLGAPLAHHTLTTPPRLRCEPARRTTLTGWSYDAYSLSDYPTLILLLGWSFQPPARRPVVRSLHQEEIFGIRAARHLAHSSLSPWTQPRSGRWGHAGHAQVVSNYRAATSFSCVATDRPFREDGEWVRGVRSTIQTPWVGRIPRTSSLGRPPAHRLRGHPQRNPGSCRASAYRHHLSRPSRAALLAGLNERDNTNTATALTRVGCFPRRVGQPMHPRQSRRATP